jgi:hypothetical protein
MAYILLLFIASSGSTSSVEVGRFKTQAECNDAAAKAAYIHRQGAAASFGLMCVAAGNATAE